jgi:hypothetical protein
MGEGLPLGNFCLAGEGVIIHQPGASTWRRGQGVSVAGYSLTICRATHYSTILMSSTPNELAIVDSEWFQPDTIEKILRSVPSILSSLSKLKSMLPKRGGSKRDPKKLAVEIDELRKDLEKVCEVISISTKSHIKFIEAFARLVSEDGPLHKLLPIIFGSVGNLNKVIPIVLAAC